LLSVWARRKQVKWLCGAAFDLNQPLFSPPLGSSWLFLLLSYIFYPPFLQAQRNSSFFCSFDFLDVVTTFAVSFFGFSPFFCLLFSVFGLLSYVFCLLSYISCLSGFLLFGLNIGVKTVLMGEVYIYLHKAIHMCVSGPQFSSCVCIWSTVFFGQRCRK